MSLKEVPGYTVKKRKERKTYASKEIVVLKIALYGERRL